MGKDLKVSSFWLYVIFVALVGCFASAYLILKTRNAHIWVPIYFLTKLKPSSKKSFPKHIMFCFVDHFEPKWGRVGIQKQESRVDRWCKEYKNIASKHLDSDGCYPKHTFFYPEEEYERRYLDDITKLCRAGFGEIEIHIHHDDDTTENFRNTIKSFVQTLHEEHGALSKCPETNEIKWGFIHGNWCLDNSRSDGKWCGLNNEITLLKELGCYADFTLPSAPDDSQTSKINSIYYATDDPHKPKSHNTGIDVKVNGTESGDLMIIQGPLCISWQDNGAIRLPKIENSDIRLEQRPKIERMNRWLDCNIHVKGREDWIFVKIHTHGAQEENMEFLLGEELDTFFTELENKYNDKKDYYLHYVSAREMYNIIKAAENGNEGNPNAYRDYILNPPLWNN